MADKVLNNILSVIFAFIMKIIKISPKAAEIASALLQAEAVKLSPAKPFIWSSGWQSPIYCDNRITLSFPKLRSTIKQHLAGVVKDYFSGANAIAGVATAGIPQGALVADLLELPFLYVRSKPKEHGMANMIEGRLQSNSRVVLVEDLISTGGSSLKAAEAIREAGGIVEGIIAIFTYGFPQAEENFKEAGIKGHSLSDYDHLLKEAINKNIIKEDQLNLLQAWRNDPGGWGKG